VPLRDSANLVADGFEVIHVGTDDRYEPDCSASAISNLGGVCCWRPVWGDTGRCIWHADVAQKPTRQLEESVPEIGERLDGAIFRDVELSGDDWLAGKTLTDSQFTNSSSRETSRGRNN
jgi:hypothetical protein